MTQIMIKSLDCMLGTRTRVAGWKAQTNTLSYVQFVYAQNVFLKNGEVILKTSISSYLSVVVLRP